MTEKRTCAVVGCVVVPKGGAEACAAHRATLALQREIQRRQQLEQELEQVLDLLLNFDDRAEQLELVEVGFPEQYKAWEAENAMLGTLEQEPPCCSAIDPTLSSACPPMRNSGCGVDSPPPPALPALPRVNRENERQVPRPAQARRRLPPPPLKAGGSGGLRPKFGPPMAHAGSGPMPTV